MVNYIGGGEAALTDEADDSDDDVDSDDEDEEETEEVDDAGATAGEALLGLADDDEEETVESGGAKDPAEADDSEDDVDSDDFALLGVGDDLFEAFFSDDTPKKKKTKPTDAPAAAVAAVAAEPVVAAVVAPIATVAEPIVEKVEEVKPTVSKPAKKPSVKKPSVKKPAAVASAESAEKPKLPFQHTPALLELAQSNKKGSDESTKHEASAENEINSGTAINQITDQLLDTNDNEFIDDSDESEGDDNMIIISSSEMHVPKVFANDTVIAAAKCADI